MIPVSQPVMGRHAKKYLLDCLETGWVSSKGPYVERFERAFADFIGTKYAVAASSGTSSLHLALAALTIGPDDEVILPALTMIATVLPVLYTGATPVLVDSEPATGNIDITKIEKRITKKTRAIIPVHLHGHPADMAGIMKLAKKYHLAVIEDAAEAHGAKIRGKNVGSFGDMGCFSFYGNKIITTGEGGMVTTNHTGLAERIRSLCNLARTPGRHFLHQEIAYAYRMSNLQAALGLAQTEDADRFVAKKRRIAETYTRLLQHMHGITLPVEVPGYTSVYWQYGILFKNKKIRDMIAQKLAARGIETREFFIPLHHQPALIHKGLFTHQKFPVADTLSRRGLCLPSGLALGTKDIHFVCRIIMQALT